MRMKTACECGNRCGYINFEDGQIYCHSCKKAQRPATHEDEVLDKLDDIACAIYFLTDVMTPFVRQNVDPRGLTDCERELLFGEDDDESETDPKGFSEPN